LYLLAVKQVVVVSPLAKDLGDIFHILGYPWKLFEKCLKIDFTTSRPLVSLQIDRHYLFDFYFEPLDKLKHERVVIAELLSLKLLFLAILLLEVLQLFFQNFLHLLFYFSNLQKYHPVQK
jgi:hypothetical protein